MYGLLFNILRETVVGEYGQHYWKDICDKSDLQDMEGEVVAKQQYDEERMSSLLETSASVLGVKTETILELCGTQFFRNIKHSGHYKVVSCLGNTLEGFLLNLDTLHDHLSLAYPKMKPLSFRAETSSTGGLLLHYFSTRKELYPMVMGMVKMVAKEFYNLTIEIKLEEKTVEVDAPLPYHYKLAIALADGEKDGGRLRGNSVVPEILSLPSSRTSFNNDPPSPDSPFSPQLGTHLMPRREERSQSTGQILRTRSGGGHSIPIGLTPSVIADLARLCPLSDLKEEDGEGGSEGGGEKDDQEEEEEDGDGGGEGDGEGGGDGEEGGEKRGLGKDETDLEQTPIPHRRLSPNVSFSPRGSPLPRRLSTLRNSDEAIATLLRRDSSHSSLMGGLPPSLLPALSDSSSKLSYCIPRTESAMSMDPGWPVTKNLFQICFPFHVIFDTSLTIHYLGVSMARLLGNAVTKEEKLTDHFTLLRPIDSFNYQTIRRNIHNPFVLSLKPHPSDQDEKESKRDNNIKPLQFRGQMVPVVNSENCPVLFIGSPRIETVEDLQLKGLYLTDLPIHDVTRELILMTHHFKAEVNVAFQLEVTKRELEMEKKKVQEEKQRADTLLHAMLPPSVAMELTTGDAHDHVVAQEVETVTILFSDIKDFTTICHSCRPMDVVSMLNELYTKFDSCIDRHKVYKVETIGDAYMVAAGLLDTSPHHAEAITNMAFDMRQAAGQVTTPHTNESIQMRIGIHTGPVVAGVVGTKMPRYCLFGHTVNTASRMESHGTAGRVHISQITYKRLRGRPYVFWNRGKIRVKGLPDLQQTYFVEPGEDHELSETFSIRVALDRSEDSEDSDWEEAADESNAFIRQKRLPSFVRYKNMRIIAPSSPIISPDVSQSSFQGNRTPSYGSRRRISVTSPPKRPTSPRELTYNPMKEKLAEKLSLASFGSLSFSKGVTSFLEHDGGNYREIGVDLPPLHGQLSVDTGSEQERKLSNVSTGVCIKVEPEGKSVMLTQERYSTSSSITQEDDESYELEVEEEVEEEEDLEMKGGTLGSKSEGDLQAAIKAKKHRKLRYHKNKCKVS